MNAACVSSRFIIINIMLTFPLPNEGVLPAQIRCVWPQNISSNNEKLDRVVGSLVGLAVGDALGASVEFRPREYLVQNPVRDMMPGGTWGLKAGQWTDDTSMALCLASSLITQQTFNPYDQMVRYKWWYKYGYLSSTGQCFDIGRATRNSLEEFCRRQYELKKYFRCQTEDEVDNLTFHQIQHSVRFNVYCSQPGVAGNGALMRLAPVPLFFYQTPFDAVEYSGQSARLTHGDERAVDACRYYAALIVAAINGESKENLLSNDFYDNHRDWFGSVKLHKDVRRVAKGSYKQPRGYEDGIRGKGHITLALEAALWAFWSDDGSYQNGALNAVNLGDDTDTTAAIYGQLAGAYYGYKRIPSQWLHELYAHDLIVCVADWLYSLGHRWIQTRQQPNHAANRTLSSTPSQRFPSTIDKNLEQNRRSNPSTSTSKRRRSLIRMPKCLRPASPENEKNINQQKSNRPRGNSAEALNNDAIGIAV